MSLSCRRTAMAGGQQRQDFAVRIKGNAANISLMDFHLPQSKQEFDLTKVGQVMLGRENNLKQFQLANDLNQEPRFGAGSTFASEEKQEARRRKYGKILERYKESDQPWVLQAGLGKSRRTFKGKSTGESMVGSNSHYYIFVKTNSKGQFDAYPVNDWCKLNSEINYKFLDSEQAEKEFQQRGKTLNYFGVMLRNRHGATEADEESSATSSKASGSSKFMLSELDDVAGSYMSDDEVAADDGAEADDSDDGGTSSKRRSAKAAKSTSEKNSGKQKMASKKKTGKSRRRGGRVTGEGDDDEALEESDEGDFDDREVEYMTSSSSSESDLDEESKSKYVEVGVAEERGLLADLAERDADELDWNDIVTTRETRSSAIDDENAADEDNDANTDPTTADGSTKNASNRGGTGDDSSSGEDDDDPDANDVSSALFIREKKSGSGSRENSRPGTPRSRSGSPAPGKIATASDPAGAIKRKGISESPLIAGSANELKRVRTEPQIANNQPEPLNEQLIRRYLTRKPMRTKDLLQKLVAKKYPYGNDELVARVTEILKKLNPRQVMQNGALYLHLDSTSTV